MAYDPSNAVTARALLEQALALTTTPTLSVTQVNLLFNLASSQTTATPPVTVYLAASLNAAAARGWMWKAGLTSNQYDIGGQGGAKLTRSQWYDHCRQMAAGYASGTLSVVGTPASGRGFGSIALNTPYTRDTLAYLDALDAAT